MKIYTKTGDDGTTGLYGSARVLKSSLRIDAIGDVDELNAALGQVLNETTDVGLSNILNEVQCRLFDIGAELATSKRPQSCISEGDVNALETSIDMLDAQLSPLKAFILPQGTQAACALHLSRTVCRRAERKVVALGAEEPLRPEIGQFINRLSDWLFVAARYCNFLEGTTETEWHSRTAGQL